MDKNDYCDKDIGKFNDVNTDKGVTTALTITAVGFLLLYSYIVMTS